MSAIYTSFPDVEEAVALRGQLNRAVEESGKATDVLAGAHRWTCTELVNKRPWKKKDR